MKGTWYSEPFPPGGGLAARGILNQLGRPNLPLFEVLAREAIQNSWDARTGESTVEFSIDGWTCTPDQQLEIRRLIEDGIPVSGLPLAESIRREPLTLLVVTDTGTTGLGGPTRADIETSNPESRDFVAFVRNVGEPRDKKFGAGTFGFGKSIFYLVSRAKTVMVYTRCRAEGSYQSRFIGCSIGDGYRLSEGPAYRPYTGRHWWGVSKDAVQEPLLDVEADEAAKSFGLQPFTGQSTGTAVIMVDPTLESGADAMHHIACAIAWHAWPKIVSSSQSMKFSVTWQGQSVVVPDPVQTPPLDAFVGAFRRLSSADTDTIECPRPQKLLGRLALERQLVRVHRPAYPASFVPPINSPVHHVALIRAPQLVVKYMAGEPLAGDVAEYAGVFMVDPDVDDAFAQSEPPTHDDWVAAQLSGDDKRFVSSALSRLRDRLRSFAEPVASEIVNAGGIPLGAASAEFASLVASAHAGGGSSMESGKAKRGEGRPGAGGGGEGGTGPRMTKRTESSAGSVDELGEPYYGQFLNELALLFPFRVVRARTGTFTVAKTAVGVDEDHVAEKEPPEGSSRPQFLGWLGPTGEVRELERLPTEGRVGQTWHAAVKPVPDTVTVLGLSLEMAGP
jgi:hypothetical protein